MTDLSVVVLTWNTKSLTLACLSQLQVALRAMGRRRDWSSEVIVVDNGSTDGTSDELRTRFPEMTLQENPGNLGFAAGMNSGLRKARGRILLLLNSDAFVGAATLEACMDALEACEQAGIVGPRLLHP
ncbi:MAG: glycosyltransferase, partial [Myxococcota bacterium]|nr:glycosyltransferase [Myxococcota bacterium]